MNYDENVKIRKITTEVKGTEITFDEYYRIDPETGEEVFDRELEITNDANLYDIYKKQKGLLTISEIKSIRKKYEMNQKEYALAIGVGEVTINRFENGAIQTEATDAVMRLSNDPDNMLDLLRKNQINIPENDYIIFLRKINELISLKRHHIAKFDENRFSNLDFETIDVNNVVDKLVQKYNNQYDLINEEYNIDTNCEYITPLKLQKLLYYIQGLALHIYGKPAFNTGILKWSYGPVVQEVYNRYHGRNPIKTPKNVKEVSNGLEMIIDIVIKSYGEYGAISLMDLTHNEEPWKNAEKNCEITQESIKEYFDKVYAN